MALRRLKTRAEFLQAARGTKVARRGFVLQTIRRPRVPDEDVTARRAGVGFTVTKKTGNAPERNRIKRRLRAAAEACADRFEASNDYVLVGRRACLDEPFAALVEGLEASLDRAHNPRPERPSGRKEKP